MKFNGKIMKVKNEDKTLLLILDLDETLIYATEEPLEWEADFRVGHYHVYQPLFSRSLFVVSERSISWQCGRQRRMIM